MSRVLQLIFGQILIWGTISFATIAQAAPVKILALGDSLTAGYGLVPDQAFPVLLEKSLKDRGHDVVLINAGVSGDTTGGGLERLEWALADQPQIVILALGANDALRGLDPAIPRANLSQILERLKKDHIQVVLAGMLAPPNLGPDYAKAFNPLFPELAQKFQVILYPFFLEGVAGHPKLNQVDGIHPNREGVEVMVRNILPSVEKALQSLSTSETKR